MVNLQRAGGVAGVLAGIGLAVEGAFWTASGWTPQTFANPTTALAFLRDNGTLLRVGVFAGALNLVFATILVAGLAARLRATSPTRAAATLHLGVVGIGAHGLVPLGLWLGVPMFITLAASDAATAQAAWGGFAVFLAAAGGLGNLFLGLSMATTGSAALGRRSRAPLPVLLGWVGIVAGMASVITVLAAGTPVAFLANAAYVPSLLLAIVFRVWAGIHLWRSPQDPGVPQASPTVHTPPADTLAAHS
jgi:hypothetical protein